MGYDLHIHRAPGDWAEAATTPITEAEWLALAQADPELVHDGNYSVRRPDGSSADFPIFGFTPPGAAEPCAFSLDPENGEITVSGAYHRGARIKAAQVADHLGGRLQGDDDEFYGQDGEPIADVDADARPPRRRMLGRLRRR